MKPVRWFRAKAGAEVDAVMAFDTGPGNMVIDACMERLFGKKFDRGGAVGRRGVVLGSVVTPGFAATPDQAPPVAHGQARVWFVRPFLGGDVMDGRYTGKPGVRRYERVSTRRVGGCGQNGAEGAESRSFLVQAQPFTQVRFPDDEHR